MRMAMALRLPQFPPVQPAQFLVVGSGIAGLYTALKLSTVGEVTLLTKNRLEESNTTYAQGGIAAAIDPQDSPELHYEDTIRAGAGLCLPEAVSVLVHEGPARVKELMHLGVPFDLQEGEPALTREAAHSRRRILHADGDATGREISRSLTRLVAQDPRITVWEETMAISLLTRGGRCHGVLALLADGTLAAFSSGATILCTGGCCQVYAATTNPPVATGDGIALAYHAGAAVVNMEFIQFHPTALYLPPAPRFLISETVRGEGGVLRNVRGERFMSNYHELADLASRDVVARAILRELERTGSCCVFLDLSALTSNQIRRRFPNIYETCLQYGLDITVDQIPVGPAAHYLMGGILTDLLGKTTLPGLYACGEVADAGVHGANRLASNSLLEGLVFGYRIAEHLSQSPPKPSAIATDLAADFRYVLPQETSPDTVSSDRRFLQEMMSARVGIIRNNQSLRQGLEVLENPAFRKKEPHTLFLEPAYLESQNLRTVARLMIRAALLRTESRGSHYREDFPATDPAWRQRIVLTRKKEEYWPIPKETTLRGEKPWNN